jgi:hypothetical protein
MLRLEQLVQAAFKSGSGLAVYSTQTNMHVLQENKAILTE